MSETLDHLIIAYDEELITKDVFMLLKQDIDTCLAKLNGYMFHTKGKKEEMLQEKTT